MENETADTERHGCDEVTHESTALSIARTIQTASNSHLLARMSVDSPAHAVSQATKTTAPTLMKQTEGLGE